MSVLSALGMGRAAAESRMSELFRVFAESRVPDPDDDLAEVVVESVAYEGPGRLVFRSSVVSDVEVASQLVASQSARVDLPAGTSGVGSGMFVVVTASSADVTLVGRRFRVEGQPAAGQTTAARFQVVEIT